MITPVGAERARRAILRVLTRTGVALAGAGALPAAAAAEAFVRVNQVGYLAGAPKRAYLMSSGAESGVRFAVRDEAGRPVFEGTIGSSAGSWSRAFPAVYALDFDPLRAPGRYTITVGQPAPASSPPFVIAPGNSVYATPTVNALSFFANERDGPEYIPSPLRSAPAHLNDASAMTYLTPKVDGSGGFRGDLKSLGAKIDAAGGWWDAGDYLKFLETTSYTVDLMLAGVRDFPAAMGADAPAGADFTGEARFGVEWLLKMWDRRSATLYYQVGIGAGNRSIAGDHDIWRLPQADDAFGAGDPLYRYIRHRPAFRAGPPGSPVSPNLAGRDAAAFALCFQVFHASDAPLAERCLRAGEQIYSLADVRPRGRLLTAIPFAFYPEREWRDDLELGAAELALALGSGAAPPSGLAHQEASFYLGQAASWAREYTRHAGANSETLNLYDVSGLADFELVHAMRQEGDPSGLALGEAGALAALRHELEAAGRQASRDPFGFGFPWARADTASHGDGLAVMAGEYDALTSTSAFAAGQSRWLGNVLGANAWGYSLIVGDGSSFPDCPSHQVANLLGSLDGSAPVLAGAVVEGPSNERSAGEVEGMRACPSAPGDPLARFNGGGAVFADDARSYTTVEPAIDLTASSMLAFGWAGARAAWLGVPAAP